MGYTDAVYRQRKLGTHALMNKLTGVLGLIEHDGNDRQVREALQGHLAYGPAA